MKNYNKGLAPTLVIFIVMAFVGIGASGYIILSRQKQIPSPPPVQSPSVQVKSEQDSKKLLGWWKQVESWSIDPSTGQLKENAEAFPFYKEFTANYACTQYSVSGSTYSCSANTFYTVSGNKITYGEKSAYYEEWIVTNGKLEILQKNSKGKVFNKSIWIWVASPTSPDKQLEAPALTRPGLSENPKASLRFVKAGPSGICLKHEGGDAIPITRINLNIDGQNTYLFGYQQFITPPDFIFDVGEAWVFVFDSLNTQLKKGSTLQIMVNNQVIAPLDSVGQPTHWIIENFKEESPLSGVLFGGLASCP